MGSAGPRTKGATCPNFAFANSHKTAKFVKVFSLESFPLYGTWDNQINKKIALAPLRTNGLTFLQKDAKESLPPPTVMPRQLSPSMKIELPVTLWYPYFQFTVTSPQLSVNCKFKNTLVNSKLQDRVLIFVLLSKDRTA